MIHIERIRELETENSHLRVTILNLRNLQSQVDDAEEQLTHSARVNAMLRVRAQKAERALSVLRDLFKDELLAIESVEPGMGGGL